MRDQEIVGLYEAYQSIYSNVNEEVEQLDEVDLGAVYNRVERTLNTSQNPLARAARALLKANPSGEEARQGKYKKEETDLFDYILEYLVAEGYADTNEAAITIMANMSEEWKQSIVETIDLQERIKPGTKGKISFSTGKQGFEQKMTGKNPKTGRQRATSPELKTIGAHSRARAQQADAERSGDTQGAKRHRTRRGKLAHAVYSRTGRIIDRADND